ncbi:MAG: hypothetical protein ACTSUE_04040 [Promethearchaeota archaeon]
MVEKRKQQKSKQTQHHSQQQSLPNAGSTVNSSAAYVKSRTHQHAGPGIAVDRPFQYEIDINELQFIRTMYQLDSDIQAAINVMMDTLFASTVNMSSSKTGTTTEISEFLAKEYWHDCGVELFHYILQFGCAPIMFKYLTNPNNGKPIQVPYVPAFGSCKLTVSINDNFEKIVEWIVKDPQISIGDNGEHVTRPLFTYVSKYSSPPDIVWGGNGYARLASKIAALVPTYIALRNRERIAENITYKLANPLTYLVHMQKDGDVNEENVKDFQNGMIKLGLAESYKVQVEGTKSKQLREGFENYARQVKSTEDTGRLQPDYTRLLGPVDFAHTRMPKTIKLPTNVTVVRDPSEPKPITDLIEYRRARSEEVSRCLGIPQSYTHSHTQSSSKQSGNVTASENDQQTLVRSAKRVRADVINALEEIWFFMEEKATCKFELELSPLTDKVTVTWLYETGSINQEQFHKMANAVGASGVDCTCCLHPTDKERNKQAIHKRIPRHGIVRSVFGEEEPEEETVSKTSNTSTSSSHQPARKKRKKDNHKRSNNYLTNH